MEFFWSVILHCAYRRPHKTTQRYPYESKWTYILQKSTSLPLCDTRRFERKTLLLSRLAMQREIFMEWSYSRHRYLSCPFDWIWEQWSPQCSNASCSTLLENQSTWSSDLTSPHFGSSERRANACISIESKRLHYVIHPYRPSSISQKRYQTSIYEIYWNVQPLSDCVVTSEHKDSSRGRDVGFSIEWWRRTLSNLIGDRRL